jgi:hypothetical protein
MMSSNWRCWVADVATWYVGGYPYSLNVCIAFSKEYNATCYVGKAHIPLNPYCVLLGIRCKLICRREAHIAFESLLLMAMAIKFLIAFYSEFNAQCYVGAGPRAVNFIDFFRNCMQRAMEEEAHMPFESWLRPMRTSMQHAIEEEAHLPLTCLLLSIRNPMRHAMEEEAHIPLTPYRVLLGIQCDMLCMRGANMPL